MTIHQHIYHVSNFNGNFQDAMELGLIEALNFFPFCADHATAALDSGALEIKVNSKNSDLSGSHTLAIEITYDDEVDLDDYDYDNDEDYEPDFPVQMFVPPF